MFELPEVVLKVESQFLTQWCHDHAKVMVALMKPDLPSLVMLVEMELLIQYLSRQDEMEVAEQGQQ